jgi:hypothetical protein
MEKLHFCLGLPRTSSTILMRILSENPKIFTTETCPTPFLISSTQNITKHRLEFSAMNKEVMKDAYFGFMRNGLKGWFESMTDKPIIISKSRSWSEYLYHTHKIYPESKYLVLLRDLRDVFCSFEKLMNEYPFDLNDKDISEPPLQYLPVEERIGCHFSYEFALGRSMYFLRHVYEMSKKNRENYFFLKHEDFNNNPKKILELLYHWLSEDYFDHNLDNIPDPEYQENYNCYSSLVSHKTGNKFVKTTFNWSKFLTNDQSNLIINTNKWYYETFYPEVLNNDF